MKKLKLAVIGKDVSKSDSPEMHTFIARELGYQVSYEKISIPEEEFNETINRIIKAYDGVNITIPYKLPIISHLKSVVGDAKTFGAVNTVDCRTLIGYNTDGLGFMLMLINNGIDVKGKKILLLGAGGAGRSVAKKLSEAGAAVSVYDRNYQNAEAVSAEFEGVKALDDLKVDSYFAVINATGVGMHNTEGISPVESEILFGCEVAVDLIYVPEKSEFLNIAEKLGKKIINGKAMLFYQAYFAECIYLGIEPDEAQAKQLFFKYTGENV